MKKLTMLVAMAIATIPISSLSSNIRNDVGEVNLIGNIVANSPMWQWTVNNYTGAYLNVKPSEATSSGGVTFYTLSAQPFIAVSGYLPSFAVINNSGSINSRTGFMDKTTFLSDGEPIKYVEDLQNGKVYFHIRIKGMKASGAPQTGLLYLESTELRGARYQWALQNSPSTINESLGIYSAPRRPFLPTPSGSCFTGIGSYTNVDGVISGTATKPLPGNEVSVTAFNQFISALEQADTMGNASRVKVVGTDRVSMTDLNCSVASSGLVANSASFSPLAPYFAAAHVVELTPKQLSFAEPAMGAWSGTLTVEAYQM